MKYRPFKIFVILLAVCIFIILIQFLNNKIDKNELIKFESEISKNKTQTSISQNVGNVFG